MNDAVEVAQKLVVTLYQCAHEDTLLQRDRAIFARLQSPALMLVAVLANAAGSVGLTYRQRGISFARAHLSEFLAILELGRRVGSIDDITHTELLKAAQKVEAALSPPA